MLDFVTTFLAWLAATGGPAIVGILAIIVAGKAIRGKYLAGFALGIFMWFFVDTIGGSANLDVNAGFTGGIVQVVIVLLFVMGVLLFFRVGGSLFSSESGIGKQILAIPLLVALAVGVHGFGEGTAFGVTAATTQSTSLLEAFGGLSAGTAYVLHKSLEPMMIGACYVVYAKDRPRNALGLLRDAVLLTIPFVVPSLVGAGTGYYISYDATYFYALGTGTSIYAALRLTKPLFQDVESPNSKETIKVAIALIIGFACIYLAALFHS